METFTKKCSKCKSIKESILFNKDKYKKDGYRNRCKVCTSEDNILYYRTKIGLIAHMYKNQKYRSKQRNHNPPEYSRKELERYLLLNKNFHTLYENWKNSGYCKEKSPSLDRKNDYIGYTFDNMDLVTWIENENKSHEDVRNGINNKKNKTVLQFNINGELIKEFHSVQEAQRQTGLWHVSDCCNGNMDSYGGFTWRYKNI